MLYHFLLALQFLTRLPIRLRTTPSHRDMGRTMGWYPLVGLLIGSLLAACGAAIAWWTESIIVTGVVVTALSIGITGGLHLDGLSDSFDAFLSGKTGEEAGRIMKDSRVGVMGVLALFVVLVAKVAGFGVLLDDGEWWAVVLAPGIGRWFGVVLVWRWSSPSWVEKGIGKQLEGQVSTNMLWWSWVPIAVVGLALAFPWYWLVPLLAGCCALAYVGLRASRVIGGMTGDTIGCTIELAETAALLAAVML